MTKQKLMIIDDSRDIRESLVEIFQEEFEILQAENGQDGLDKIVDFDPDIVLLDVVMPIMDGFQTCLRLRQQEATKNIPIIFLTTKNEPQTETFGLELGADDFMHKPFNSDVLKARVKRRLEGAASAATGSVGETTELEGFLIEWDRQEISHGDERISLTTKELGLLRLFVQNKGRVLSRETILERVWADTYITDRTIDSHVKELRKKIPPLVTLLKTVYGAGYRLDL